MFIYVIFFRKYYCYLIFIQIIINFLSNFINYFLTITLLYSLLPNLTYLPYKTLYNSNLYLYKML